MNIEYRNIRPEEGAQAAQMERVCFPPNEAEAPEYIIARAARIPDMFLAAYDTDAHRLAGFINGIATDEEHFRDGFFTDISLHRPDGRNVMILGLEVLPDYRGHGIARELMRRYLQTAKQAGRYSAHLTCLDDKVLMYSNMGFTDLGASSSSWGGEDWREMSVLL